MSNEPGSSQNEKQFDAIMLDTMNIAHRLKHKSNQKAEKVGDRKVYRDLAREYIELVYSLADRFLRPGGEVYLLFDNPTSRIGLQKTFYNVDRKQVFSEYKSGRKKEPKEFYATLDLIKYYFMTNKPTFFCAQIANLEADDLVKPLLDYKLRDKLSLMVTNDYDWARYLSNKTLWLKDFYEQPVSPEDFVNILGFYPTEWSIITYKSLFGDPSDGIPQIMRESKANKEYFLQLVKNREHFDPKNLLLFPRKENPEFYQTVEDSRQQYLINVQLTSSMPVDESHFKRVLVRGRDSGVVVDSIEKILGMKALSSEKFQFGNVKPPRT